MHTNSVGLLLSETCYVDCTARVLFGETITARVNGGVIITARVSRTSIARLEPNREVPGGRVSRIDFIITKSQCFVNLISNHKVLVPF